MGLHRVRRDFRFHFSLPSEPPGKLCLYLSFQIKEACLELDSLRTEGKEGWLFKFLSIFHRSRQAKRLRLALMGQEL